MYLEMFVFLKTTRERFDTGKFDYSREQKSSLLLPYFQLGKVILKVKKKKSTSRFECFASYSNLNSI